MSRAPIPRRSPLQVAASQANGARSAGPRTTEGRFTSSANSVRSGIYAKCTLLPGEDPDAVTKLVRGWVSGLGARSFPAAQLARHCADAALRMDRIERLRDRLLAERLEARLGESDANNKLEQIRQTREAVVGLAELAQHVTAPVPREHAQGLLAPVRRVIEVVAEIGLDVSVTGPLAAAAKALDTDDIVDIQPTVFAVLATASRGVVQGIDGKLPELVRAVEIERERQNTLLALADDSQLRSLDKLKGRLVKEIDTYVRTLLAIQELEAVSGEHGADEVAVPVSVEFKAVGGALPR